MNLWIFLLYVQLSTAALTAKKCNVYRQEYRDFPKEISREFLREKGCLDIDNNERFEKEALDVIREEEERQRQVKDEQERKEKEAEALQYFAKLDKNGDGYISKDELIFKVVLDQNNDGQVSDEEVNFYMSGHENYDEKTFLNTGWQLMKHLYSKYE